MNPYEMTFIIRPDRDEDGTRAAADSVTSRISAAGGEIIATIPWNPPRRRMAYTIRDFGDGFYVTTVFRIDPTALPAIENTLKLNDNILRFLLVQATEMNIKQAVQRLQQQQAPATPPTPQPVPAGAASQTGEPGAEAPGADTSAGEPQVIENPPVVPPTVEVQPIVGTEPADAASALSSSAEETPDELSPEPVAVTADTQE